MHVLNIVLPIWSDAILMLSSVTYPGGMHRMHVHPPSPPCASPPPGHVHPPPSPAGKAGYERRWVSGQQEKNASLFTCDLIIFCRVSTLLVTYSKVYIAVQFSVADSDWSGLVGMLCYKSYPYRNCQNQCCGSGFNGVRWIWIQIQVGKNYPRK